MERVGGELEKRREKKMKGKGKGEKWTGIRTSGMKKEEWQWKEIRELFEGKKWEQWGRC